MSIFSGFLPFPLKYDLLKLSFLTSLSHSENISSDPLFLADYSELTAISSKYSLNGINNITNCFNLEYDPILNSL